MAAPNSRSPQRRLIGLCGPPGVGKSTIAGLLANQFDSRAVVLGMDGFHLANTTLERLGLRTVKGAPETFDPYGFIALLRRVRGPIATEQIYAPAYDRSIGAGVTGVLEIQADHETVIVEGNYLLLDGRWKNVQELLDLTVYLELDEEVRLKRLIDRHIRYGRSPEEAAEWVQRSDEANARLIERTAARADYVLNVDDVPTQP